MRVSLSKKNYNFIKSTPFEVESKIVTISNVLLKEGWMLVDELEFLFAKAI